MTRPAAQSLVLDGNTIKLRLQADRLAYASPVHVDWLRFTLPLRAAPAPHADLLFPVHQDNRWHEETRSRMLSALLSSMPDCEVAGAQGKSFQPHEKAAALEAFDTAEKVAAYLGKDFSVAVEVRKGHDFYKYRWSILRSEAEVGWVGFLSSSTSPRQQAQNRTIHVNLYGSACTFGQFGWRNKVADYIDATSADITRVDLALDFFDGLPGGMDWIVEQYKAGLCNVGGKTPKCNMLGDWCNGHERSFYLGSKEAGKQTNFYEKGDQLFGVEAENPWLRGELRYGNKLRVLPSDILRKPADFFGGASDFHASLLALHKTQATLTAIKTRARLAQQTVHAEASRNLRWAVHTAMATLGMWVKEGPEQFLEFVKTEAIPKRLMKFTAAERRAAMAEALGSFKPAAGAGHAFAAA